MPDENWPSILITGAGGQVGWELARTLAPLGTVLAHDRRTLDLGDLDGVRRVVRAAQPAVIVNAAAYTNVDRAETESAVAQRINADAPAVLAEEARRAGALVIHYSTDYVFDGLATVPYREVDPAAPATVYGRSKRDGETAVLHTGCDAYIFRIAWVYGLRRHNFLRTIQRLAAERDELAVVADQHGGPTWCRTVAEATAAALSQLLAARRAGSAIPPPGVYHMAPPDATTWFEFAQAIVSASARPERRPAVRPIATGEYSTVARRPAWSVLDSGRFQAAFGLRLPSWREQLALCLDSSHATSS